MKGIFKNKLVLIAVVLLLFLVLFFIWKMRTTNNSVNTKKTSVSTTTNDELEKVDPSVKVKLIKLNKKNTVELSIIGIPEGTESIDYQLSYKTVTKGEQGVIGTISNSDFINNSVKREIFFGTCSSGKCVYHKVSGDINVSLTFSGNYGERIFEKDFSLKM